VFLSPLNRLSSLPKGQPHNLEGRPLQELLQHVERDLRLVLGDHVACGGLIEKHKRSERKGYRLLAAAAARQAIRARAHVPASYTCKKVKPLAVRASPLPEFQSLTGALWKSSLWSHSKLYVQAWLPK
jgi:hypothetical protein